MGIYIDSITMPDSCDNCFCNYDDLYCLITEEKVVFQKRKTNCPLKEIKTEQWIEEHDGNGWNDWINLKCPVCGKVQNRVPYIYNYCPNCGVKMKGADE